VALDGAQDSSPLAVLYDGTGVYLPGQGSRVLSQSRSHPWTLLGIHLVKVGKEQGTARHICVCRSNSGSTMLFEKCLELLPGCGG
jgi:hypothetical protein